MKLLLLALSVALLFAAGEALNCHRCVSRVAGEDCELTTETCRPDKNGCAVAKFLRPPYGSYQKCMAVEDCMLLMDNSFMHIKCCDHDMCNVAFS
ncbi:CD59B glycoprotein [Syngnathoides biaculeatus]|uniref:CD59B glycoprotein n=1 Tax=Syngnathoides biaculeatus TaxID=300417 RepID=UPI002ADDDE8B|nr:CD59B glycoprotein [Syngnathoides biaculeatus]XP_061695448.1 CD59B glycoprotein [Syngnathoides biaculeatus]